MSSSEGFKGDRKALDGMIPELPETCNLEQQVEFYKSLVARLDSQNEFHVKWYSHKKDPSTCWMCDQQILVYKVIALCEDILQSRTVDIETASRSDAEEYDSESNDEPKGESDEDQESTYNEPEYDTEVDVN